MVGLGEKKRKRVGEEDVEYDEEQLKEEVQMQEEGQLQEEVQMQEEGQLQEEVQLQEEIQMQGEGQLQEEVQMQEDQAQELQEHDHIHEEVIQNQESHAHEQMHIMEGEVLVEASQDGTMVVHHEMEEQEPITAEEAVATAAALTDGAIPPENTMMADEHVDSNTMMPQDANMSEANVSDTTNGIHPTHLIGDATNCADISPHPHDEVVMTHGKNASEGLVATINAVVEVAEATIAEAAQVMDKMDANMDGNIEIQGNDHEGEIAQDDARVEEGVVFDETTVQV